MQHAYHSLFTFFNTGHSVQQTCTYYWTLGPAYYHTLCTFLKLILGILSSRSVHIIELYVQHTITHSAHSLILDILSNRRMRAISLSISAHHTITHCARSLILDILSNRPMHIIRLSVQHTITHCARFLILDILSNRPLHIIELSVQHTITHSARSLN